jgi:hypothetical protein
MGLVASEKPKTCLKNEDTTNQSKESELQKHSYSKPK